MVGTVLSVLSEVRDEAAHGLGRVQLPRQGREGGRIALSPGLGAQE